MNIHRFIQATKVTTTSEVAKKMHLSWNTAEKRLLELALENKVERIKKAGVNLWVIK
jgi:Mn-dependent DtxR family transcriptional regulator